MIHKNRTLQIKTGMTKRTKPNIGTIALDECGFTEDH